MPAAELDAGGRWRRALAAVLAAGIVVISSAVAPEALPMGPCLVKQITGISCLSCGMTRSFHAMAQGHWAEGFRFHLFGPPLFVGVVVAGCIAAGEAAAGRRLLPRPPHAVTKNMLIVAASLWVLYGLVRAAWEVVHHSP